MSDVPQILQQIEDGDPSASERLLPLVYDELRKLAAARLAREKPGQSLDATGLVHEAYLRLVIGNEEQQWNGRGHFFGAAAEAMRRILIDRARNGKRLKRGGDMHRVNLEEIEVAFDASPEWLLAIDDALENLAADYKECADLIKLRFFVGMSHGEAAMALGIPRRTADRQWAFARAWLYQHLNSEGTSEDLENS